jgi:hypothetical protein
MSIAVEALFTSALGLKKPWIVTEVALDGGKKRIDFEVSWDAKRMNCPVCNTSDLLWSNYAGHLNRWIIHQKRKIT